MKRILIVVLTVAGAVAGYLYNPAPAECQVGAPCGAGTQSSIDLVAPEAPEWAQEAAAPTFDYADQVSAESTTSGYTFVDTDGTLQAVAGGGLPTGTYTYSCADAYAASCAARANSGNSFSITEIEGPYPDCAVPGTSATASQTVPAPIVYAPSVSCVAYGAGTQQAIPAPPNDQVTFTTSNVFVSAESDVDGWAVQFSTGVPYTNPGEGAEWDACLANLDYSGATELVTMDAAWITTYMEGTSLAPAATGLCCVAETAFGVPAQSGCAYQGGGISVEVIGHLSRCSVPAAPPGGAAGLAASDSCVTVIEAIDSGNVCPQDWCTLNPGDPACGP